MWAEIVAFDLPDPDVTSITKSVNERHGDISSTILVETDSPIR